MSSSAGAGGPSRIICIVGARPNFMKIAPVLRALKARGVDAMLVHTGQHYDQAMKEDFFDQLGIPTPDVDLEVGSASHAQQTAEIMKRFEPVLLEDRPDAVLVVGDVNSTIACALVAVKEHVPVVHVEAGLRSFDRYMPEEINRILTDQLSDLLFTTEEAGAANLQAEGIPRSRVHYVGNVMIDTLKANLDRASRPEEVMQRHAPGTTSFAGEAGYSLLTLHRPSNVDDPAVLEGLIDTLIGLAEKVPVIFPVHPRTHARLESSGLIVRLEASENVALLPPLPYLDLLGLMANARYVLTDSGGIQEETTALGVPCVTLRENTERPITVTEGTNEIVGTSSTRIRAVVEDILETGGKSGRVPEFWDGRAAERIAEVVEAWLVEKYRVGSAEA